MSESSTYSGRGRNEAYLNFINGQWRQGSAPEWDENRCPARPGELLGRITRSTPADVSKAIEAATLAQKDWVKRSRPARAALLEKVTQLMKARADQFSKIITVEQGKNLNEAKVEHGEAVQFLEQIASEGRRPVGEILSSGSGGKLNYSARAPLGVVASISTWCSPLVIPVRDLAPALLEGNAVLIKPSSLAPATARMLVLLFEEAGAPTGLVNLVYGQGAVVGPAIVSDPRVKAISFAGSREVGVVIRTQAAARGARLRLDLGGKASAIVCADADLDLAAVAIASAAFDCSGQRSKSTSRVVVERAVHAAFIEKLVARVRQIRVGDGLTNPDAMGPMVDMKRYKATLKIIEEAKEEGARLVCGGEPCTAPGGGHFVTPTIFDEVAPGMKIAREEVLGPILSIIPVDSFDVAVSTVGLFGDAPSGTVYSTNFSRMMEYADRVPAELVYANQPSTQAALAQSALDFFCTIKTVCLDYGLAR